MTTFKEIKAACDTSDVKLKAMCGKIIDAQTEEEFDGVIKQIIDFQEGVK